MEKIKVKRRVSDNEVLEVQSHPTHILVAGPDEVIEDHEGERPYAGMVKIAPGQYRVKPPKPEDPAEKENRKNGKRAVFAKLGITASDIPHLRAAIEDGHLD